MVAKKLRAGYSREMGFLCRDFTVSSVQEPSSPNPKTLPRHGAQHKVSEAQEQKLPSVLVRCRKNAGADTIPSGLSLRLLRNNKEGGFTSSIHLDLPSSKMKTLNPEHVRCSQ